MDHYTILEEIVNKVQENVNTAPERKEEVLTEIVKVVGPATYRTPAVSVDSYNGFYDKCVKLERDRLGLDDYNIEGKRMVSLFPKDNYTEKVATYGPIVAGIVAGTFIGVVEKSVLAGIGMAIIQTLGCYAGLIGMAYGFLKLSEKDSNEEFQQSINQEKENTVKLLNPSNLPTS